MTLAIDQKIFGKLSDGREVPLYILRDGHGMEVELIAWGATIRCIRVPDKDGIVDDVVLGFDRLDQYETTHPYFGATVGRVAGRIPGGKLSLDGNSFQLPVNQAPNHLHGGFDGFDKRLWNSEITGTAEAPSVTFSLVDPDGSNGYPGTLEVLLEVSLCEPGVLRLRHHATSDKPTPVSLTNHSYFNLAGAGNSDILDHELQMFSSEIFPVDENFVPMASAVDVGGTPSDFREPVRIGKVLHQLHDCHGDFYKLPGESECKCAARVTCPQTGRILEAWTNEPCLQLYTLAAVTEPIPGKAGKTYQRFGAFCLECEGHPGAIGHPEFASHIARPGKPVERETRYIFSTTNIKPNEQV
jgi:aldose 1-epimerase